MSDTPSKTTVSQDFGFLLIRLILGAVMIFHGAQKVFGEFGGPGIEKFTEVVEAKIELPKFVPAKVAAQAAAWSEFGGGILLVFGLFTRLAALFIAATMGVASFVIHGAAFSLKDGGMEYALTLGVVAVALIFIGPGRISIDQLFFGRTKPSDAK